MIAVDLKRKWEIVNRLWLTLEEVQTLRRTLLTNRQERKAVYAQTDYKQLINTLKTIEDKLWDIKEKAIKLGYDEENRLRIALTWEV